MTRKPDGWVDLDWRDQLKKFKEVRLWGSRAFGSPLPVCLVPPALLDWVEEVEDVLMREEFRHRYDNYPGTATQFQALLDKLKEVRG